MKFIFLNKKNGGDFMENILHIKGERHGGKERRDEGFCRENNNNNSILVAHGDRNYAVRISTQTFLPLA